MDTKTSRVVNFALCYLMANSDDENVTDLFEELTESEQPEVWLDFVDDIRGSLGFIKPAMGR